MALVYSITRTDDVYKILVSEDVILEIKYISDINPEVVSTNNIPANIETIISFPKDGEFYLSMKAGLEEVTTTLTILKYLQVSISDNVSSILCANCGTPQVKSCSTSTTAQTEKLLTYKNIFNQIISYQNIYVPRHGKTLQDTFFIFVRKAYPKINYNAQSDINDSFFSDLMTGSTIFDENLFTAHLFIHWAGMYFTEKKSLNITGGTELVYLQEKFNYEEITNCAYSLGYSIFDLIDIYEAIEVVVISQPEEDVTPPTLPTNFRALQVGTTVLLQWSLSTDESLPIRYYIQRKNGLNPTPWINYINVGDTEDGSIIDENVNEASYTYRIIAQDAVGNNTTDVVSTTITIVSEAKPTAPVLSVVGAQSKANLSWTASQSSPGIKNYVVEYTPTSNVNWSAPTVVNLNNVLEHVITLPGGEYKFRVYAKDVNNKIGSMSNIVTLNVQAPKVLTLYSFQFDNSTDETIGIDSVNTLDLVANGTALSEQVMTSQGRFINYTKYGKVGFAIVNASLVGRETSLPYSISDNLKDVTEDFDVVYNATKDITYYVYKTSTVPANLFFKFGVPSDVVPIENEKTPINLVLDNKHEVFRSKISWEKPLTIIESLTYVLEYTPTSNVDWNPATVTTVPTADLFAILLKSDFLAEEYKFRVASFDVSNVKSPYISIIGAVVDLVAPTAPTGLGMTSNHDLYWDASQDEQGVSSYIIQYTTAANTTWAGNVESVSVGDVVVYNLDLPKGEYRFRVYAVDLQGNQSDFSNEITFVYESSVEIYFNLVSSGVYPGFTIQDVDLIDYEQNGEIPEPEILEGIDFALDYDGRIMFTIVNSFEYRRSENRPYGIFLENGTEITNQFDTNYDDTRDITFYVSRNIYEGQDLFLRFGEASEVPVTQLIEQKVSYKTTAENSSGVCDINADMEGNFLYYGTGLEAGPIPPYEGAVMYTSPDKTPGTEFKRTFAAFYTMNHVNIVALTQTIYSVGISTEGKVTSIVECITGGVDTPTPGTTYNLKARISTYSGSEAQFPCAENITLDGNSTVLYYGSGTSGELRSPTPSDVFYLTTARNSPDQFIPVAGVFFLMEYTNAQGALEISVVSFNAIAKLESIEFCSDIVFTADVDSIGYVQEPFQTLTLAYDAATAQEYSQPLQSKLFYGSTTTDPVNKRLPVVGETLYIDMRRKTPVNGIYDGSGYLFEQDLNGLVTRYIAEIDENGVLQSIVEYANFNPVTYFNLSVLYDNTVYATHTLACDVDPDFTQTFYYGGNIEPDFRLPIVGEELFTTVEKTPGTQLPLVGTLLMKYKTDVYSVTVTAGGIVSGTTYCSVFVPKLRLHVKYDINPYQSLELIQGACGGEVNYKGILYYTSIAEDEANVVRAPQADDQLYTNPERTIIFTGGFSVNEEGYYLFESTINNVVTFYIADINSDGKIVTVTECVYDPNVNVPVYLDLQVSVSGVKQGVFDPLGLVCQSASLIIPLHYGNNEEVNRLPIEGEFMYTSIEKESVFTAGINEEDGYFIMAHTLDGVTTRYAIIIDELGKVGTITTCQGEVINPPPVVSTPAEFSAAFSPTARIDWREVCGDQPLYNDTLYYGEPTEVELRHPLKGEKVYLDEARENAIQGASKFYALSYVKGLVTRAMVIQIANDGEVLDIFDCQ